MTTIAFHKESNTVAVDSRMTMNGVVVDGNANKATVKRGVVFIVSGKVCDTDTLINHYFMEDNTETLPECSAIVIDNGKAYHVVVNDSFVVDKFAITQDFAIGSGGDFALAAMDFGCNAQEAVKYASKRCIHTGGRVKVFKVK